MSYFRFDSIARSDSTGYLVDSTESIPASRLRGDNLADWAQEFETYGDGRVQHAGATFVRVHNGIDFLRSLAVHLMTVDHETLLAFAKEWPRPYFSEDRITFYSRLKHREDKPQWYSTYDDKVSSRDCWRHDRRWNEIASWMDGSLSSVYSLAVGAHYCNGVLGRYAVAHHCTEVYARLTDRTFSSDHSCRLLELFSDQSGSSAYNVKWDFDGAWHAVNSLVESARLRDHCARSISAWERNREMQFQGATA